MITGGNLQIGRYDVVGQVGAGSTGVVWLATQPEVDRPVAIKQLAADLASDPDFRDRFRTEARVLASLTTPNVVAVYDYVETADGAYIVEEYVDGSSLAGWSPRPAGSLPNRPWASREVRCAASPTRTTPGWCTVT